MKINFRKIVIAGLLAVCLCFAGGGAVLADDYNNEIWVQVQSLEQQILLLQIHLIQIQIADLQAQLEQFNYKKCADGTANNQCSAMVKSRYCREGVLVDECRRCGCPPDGSYCSPSGACKGATMCIDGTKPGKCSADKPNFCLDEEMGFINDCKHCGCSSGKSCSSDGDCR